MKKKSQETGVEDAISYSDRLTEKGLFEARQEESKE
jgi:hypothetical protein